ncbi:MAG: DNA polymerase III subunit gamma/tau, partial [Proteobacteria bacterium]|nr:DNA polymerase III subunit gamma/tau [Pseudomonadota bacterium]
MSYEVLARRWRPLTFDDVCGQQHVTRALRNAIRLERLPHALLLAGPRGVGKTTLARILARGLNCAQGPTEKPCGECDDCVRIAAGTSLDVQEIDAASNTGVDNVREIRDSVRYAAAPGKHRIFIIDEVHMLSQAAFNALLKTLEEPPPNSLFVLATTDPQKIPATVLSRVQRFDLKALGPAEAFERLRQIAAAEEIEIAEPVLRALARESAGSLRDALTLLDRLTSGLGSTIGEEEANAVLDLIDRRVLTEVVEPVLARDAAKALQAVRGALERGIEPSRLGAGVLEQLRDLIVARVVDDPGPLLDGSPEEVAELQERARPHAPETLQKLFRVLLSRIEDLTYAPRPDHVIEMAIARLATLPDAEEIGRLIARLDALGGDSPGPSGGGAPPGRPGPGRAPTQSAATAGAPPAAPPPPEG